MPRSWKAFGIKYYDYRRENLDAVSFPKSRYLRTGASGNDLLLGLLWVALFFASREGSR